MLTYLYDVSGDSHMPKATIYTAPECPHSKKLKLFLQENEIDFEEKSILSSKAVLDELKGVSGQMGVPVTVIGDGVFAGFDNRVERRIKRQLGV
jgi:glutaredoxin 3